MIKKIGIKYKCILVLTVTIFLTACFSSAEFEYDGSYPELYSVAISSILGQEGRDAYAPPGGADPILYVLAEDSHGRRLFTYGEGSFISVFSKVIIQKVEGDYAYFYPHYNFISGNNSYPITERRIRDLKEANSWNQPMSDSDEFERVRIVRQREEGPVSREKLVEVFGYIFPGESITKSQANSAMFFLRTDNYGRSVYLGEGSGREWIETYIAVLFQPDDSFDIETGMLVIEDLNNYQTELRLFMEANGWNEPWDD